MRDYRHQQYRRGFDAEDAGAQVYDVPAGLRGHVYFFVGESAFGTDGQKNLRWRFSVIRRVHEMHHWIGVEHTF